MKRTLLEIVREILSDMEGDDVSSYTDTVESQQVAEVVRATYDQIISGRDWPHLYRTFRPSTTFPGTLTRLMLPENVMDIKFVKYNKLKFGDNRDRYEEIPFKEPQVFFEITDARNNEADNVDVWFDQESGVMVNVYNDRHPTMYTAIGEASLIFDAFDDQFDELLRGSDCWIYGKLYPNYTMDDSLYFPLPIEAYPYFIEEAKSTCFLTLKQMPNALADRHATTHRRRMSQKAWTIRNGITFPNYGRKGKGR